MQKNLRIQHLALTSVAALAITGCGGGGSGDNTADPVSFTHLRAHETESHLVCRLFL